MLASAVAMHATTARHQHISNAKEANVKIAVSTLAIVFALVLGVTSAKVVASPASETKAKTFYDVIELDSLGGTISRANSLNDRGWASGYSNLSTGARHAALWIGTKPKDLGSLGGASLSSSIVWPVKNDSGLLVGITETGEVDPNAEPWSCSAFIPRSDHKCVGFAWKNGVMRPLRTLGGNNSFAAGANNNGEITGWAENATVDSDCVNGQVLQFRPVVWGPGPNAVRELPLYPGDKAGAATAINDRGQAVGISGICDQGVGRFSAKHALLWERGKATLIPDLGAGMWSTPMAINQQGDVVGFVAIAGSDPDNPRLRAFLWSKRGGFKNLGTLKAEHDYSEAHGINALGQITGVSCVSGDQPLTCHAFLWENGKMTDLNDLVTYDKILINGQDINDLGEISGRALDPAATAVRPAFVARPIH
jgi:probable HAF family extracellular repeat protein